MHADPVDNTTAAMVARLPADPSALGTAWVCLGSPCAGASLPCYPEGTVPDRLARGGPNRIHGAGDVRLPGRGGAAYPGAQGVSSRAPAHVPSPLAGAAT